MAKLAFMTIGLLHAPTGDPQVQGFVDRIDPNFTSAAASARISRPFGVAG